METMVPRLENKGHSLYFSLDCQSIGFNNQSLTLFFPNGIMSRMLGADRPAARVGR